MAHRIAGPRHEGDLPGPEDQTRVPALTGGFLATVPPIEVKVIFLNNQIFGFGLGVFLLFLLVSTISFLFFSLGLFFCFVSKVFKLNN